MTRRVCQAWSWLRTGSPPPPPPPPHWNLKCLKLAILNRPQICSSFTLFGYSHVRSKILWISILFFLYIAHFGHIVLLRPSSSKNTYFCPSVCLSVHLTVCYNFLTMFLSLHHPEIFRSYYHWQMWCPCKRSRSKVKVTEVMTQFSHFRTVTAVWIHIWRWNDAQSLVLLRRGALLLFKVIHQISRSQS